MILSCRKGSSHIKFIPLLAEPLKLILMAGLGPYLKRIPNRTGIYFQRAVPRALQEKLGKKSWQWKAGETFIQARRNVQELLAKTDEEIALATGTVNEALLKQIDSIPLYGFRQGL